MEEKSKRLKKVCQKRKTANSSKMQSEDIEKFSKKKLKNEDSPTEAEKPTATENNALEQIVKPLVADNSDQSFGEEKSNETTIKAQPSIDFKATDANFSTDTQKSSMFNDGSVQKATLVKKAVLEQILEPIEPANIDQGNSPENADKNTLKEATKQEQPSKHSNAVTHEADANPNQEKSISQTAVEATPPTSSINETHSEDTRSPKDLSNLPMVKPNEPLLPSADDCSQAGNWQIGTLSPVESTTVLDYLPEKKRNFSNDFITLSVPTITRIAPCYTMPHTSASDDAVSQGWFNNHMLDEILSPVDTLFDLETLPSVYVDDVETKPKLQRGRKPDAAMAAAARNKTARRSMSKSKPAPNISEAYVPYNNPLIVDYTPKVIVEPVNPSFVLPKRYSCNQDDRECHKTDKEAELLPPPPNPTFDSINQQQNRLPYFNDCSAKSEPQQADCASPTLDVSTQPPNIPKFKVLAKSNGQMKPVYLTATELKNVREVRPYKLLEQKPPPPISSVVQLLRAKRRDLQLAQRSLQEKPKVFIEATQHPTTNKPSSQQRLKSFHILRQKDNKKNYKPCFSSTEDATTSSAATQDTTNDTMSKSLQKHKTQASVIADFEHTVQDAAVTSFYKKSNDGNLFQNNEPTRRIKDVGMESVKHHMPENPTIKPAVASSSTLESQLNSGYSSQEVATFCNIEHNYKVSENPESESSTVLKEATGCVSKLLSSNPSSPGNNMDFYNDEANLTRNKISDLTENNSSNYSATNESISSKDVGNIADIIAEFEVLLDDEFQSLKFATIDDIDEFIEGTTTLEASQHSNNVSHNKTALETARNISAMSPKESTLTATAYNEVVSNSNNYEKHKDKTAQEMGECSCLSLNASTTCLPQTKNMAGFSNNYKVFENFNNDEILENVERSSKDTTRSDASQLYASPLGVTKHIEDFSKHNQVFKKSNKYETLEDMERYLKDTTSAGASWSSDFNDVLNNDAAEKPSLGLDIFPECATKTFLPVDSSSYNDVLENCNDYDALEDIDEYIKEITKSETSQNSHSDNVSNNKTALKMDEHSSRSLDNSSTSCSDTKCTKTFPNYYELFDNLIEGYIKYTTALKAFQSSDFNNGPAQETASMPESKFIKSFYNYNETFDNATQKSETIEDIERYIKDTTPADASRNTDSYSTQEPAESSSLGLDDATKSGTFFDSEKSLLEFLESAYEESQNEIERIIVPETNPYESQQSIKDQEPTETLDKSLSKTVVAAKNSHKTYSGHSSRKSKNLPRHVSLQGSNLCPPHVVSTFSDNSSKSRVITRGRVKTNIDNISRPSFSVDTKPKQETLKYGRKLRHSTKSFAESDSADTTDDEIEAIGRVLMADEMKQADTLHISKENHDHDDTAPKSASVAESKKVRNPSKRRKKEPHSLVRAETTKVETTEIYKSKRRKCKDRTPGAI